jgi:glycosyltransferase involved in cell wall biosynthesis
VKILLVTERFRPLIGGAESVLGELARELARLGERVTVLTARWDDDWAEQERVDDVEIVRLARRRVRSIGTMLFLQSLRRWLLSGGREFDVWYVSMLKHCAWVGVGAASRCGRPIVLRAEGAGPTGDVAWQAGAWGGHWIRARCQRASAVVALNDRIRRELIGVGVAEHCIHEVPNGVPLPPLEDAADRLIWRHRLGLPTTGPMTVFVGRISPEKGLADLVEAWKHVTKQIADARLTVVGEGPQAATLRTLAADQPNIHWAGPTQQPQRYLRAADLFVLPSYEEGVSIALLEAMAAAVPIVATDIPGNQRLIESGRHGLLAPPRRPDLLAQNILVQLRATTIGAAMARAARVRVEDEFSITHMARRHIELFQSLLRKT